MTSQITSVTIVYWSVYSGADQTKHQSSASLAFVWGIHRWPVNSPHKGPVTRKMFPFDDVIMHRIRLGDHECINIWKRLPHYSPSITSGFPDKGQWYRAMMFSFLLAWTYYSNDGVTLWTHCPWEMWLQSWIDHFHKVILWRYLKHSPWNSSQVNAKRPHWWLTSITFMRITCVNTVRYRYNAANYLQNPYNRHPIARPWGRGMGCLLRVWSLI